MRIIAGEHRGAQLSAPRGTDTTRPTQDKVKESLFSIIQAYVPEARVLDLFAGSGALALEAVSRGAQSAAMADQDREAAACIRRNVDKLRCGDRVRLYACDWKLALQRMKADGRRFDLVFLDPPYRLPVLGECLCALAKLELLEPQAMLVLEHLTGEQPPADERFEVWKQRAYGDTQIHFLLYRPTADEGRQQA